MQNLKQRFLQIQEPDGTMPNEIEAIEKRLSVRLPVDFRYIASFFSGGMLGCIDLFAFSPMISPNIIDETLRLRRSIQLPPDYLFLAEPPESIIVLNTKAVPAVLWLDAVDVNCLPDQSFQNPPDMWKNFKDFFIYLLEQEEDF